MKKNRLVLGGMLWGLLLGAWAEEPPSEWSFKLTPYAWFGGTGGTVVTDGEEIDFDLAFKDIFAIASGGFQFNFEAAHGRFFTAFDGTWADLRYSGALLRGTANIQIKQSILELRAGYRLTGPEFRAASRQERGFPHGEMVFDAYLGGRYWLTDIDLQVRFPILPDIQVSERDEWVEPLVGGRFRVGMTPRTALLLDGNVGGFGLGDAADITWTFSTFVDWRFGKHSDLLVGWRTQGVEEMSGSGANRNGSEFVTTGPILGYSYLF